MNSENNIIQSTNEGILCKIRTMYKLIALFETELESKYSVSLNEGMLLCILSKQKQLSSGEIAEQLSLTTSNASKVIKAVESKKLIRRVIGKSDKRQMYFSITEKGLNILSNIKCADLNLPDELKFLCTK